MTDTLYGHLRPEVDEGIRGVDASLASVGVDTLMEEIAEELAGELAGVS